MDESFADLLSSRKTYAIRSLWGSRSPVAFRTDTDLRWQPPIVLRSHARPPPSHPGGASRGEQPSLGMTELLSIKCRNMLR